MSGDIRVLVQMRHTASVAAAAFEAAAVSRAYPLAAVAGVELDEAYQPVQIPVKERRLGAPVRVGELFGLNTAPEASSYVVRATVKNKASLKKLLKAAGKSDEVVGVFSDSKISTCQVCPSGPVGTDKYVEQLLQVHELQQRGMDGAGARVVIVDTGVNMAYLKQKGKTPGFDESRSWSPNPGDIPGELEVDHGTMCAYDACIAAPECTLIDHALLRSQAEGESVMDGFLSDAVRSYGLLLRILTEEKTASVVESPDAVPMVVNNSWGMFHSSWDFPVGDPMNYSDNHDHPFNVIVASLEAAGADILFAAGNCGRECADGRCRDETDSGIFGANSSEAVLSVAGVIITKERIGYSTRGPGRLVEQKPDIACYTHFKGSGVYRQDGGTSAATPVAAGLVAAVRSAYPQTVLPPAVLRNLIRRTAEDRGAQGFDYEYGYGVVDTGGLLAALEGFGTQ
jgi:Subtilase family